MITTDVVTTVTPMAPLYAGPVAPWATFTAQGASDKPLAVPPLFKTPEGDSSPLVDVNAVMLATIGRLTQSLAGAVREAGVSTPPPLVIGMEKGALTLEAHPQKEAFSRLLEQDPEARRDLGLTLALKRLSETGKAEKEFLREYAANPEAATARWRYVWEEAAAARPKLLLAVENGQLQFAFGSSMHASRFLRDPVA